MHPLIKTKILSILLYKQLQCQGREEGFMNERIIEAEKLQTNSCFDKMK
jgi:hypothetical protein